MLYYYGLAEDGHICFTSETLSTIYDENGKAAGKREQFDFPENFDFFTQNDYKIIDGELVYDPLPEQEEIPEATWEDVIEAQVTYTALMTDTLLGV